MEELKPVFTDLSNEHLLRKCLHGGTQNPCESLINVILVSTSKIQLCNEEHFVELGVYEAVATFNDGNITKCEILAMIQ